MRETPHIATTLPPEGSQDEPAPIVDGQSFVAVVVPLSFVDGGYLGVRQEIAQADSGWVVLEALQPLLIRHLADQVATSDQHRPGELLSWWFWSEGVRAGWDRMFRLRAGNRPEFRISRVELPLFDLGVGFLILFVEPASRDVRDWQDLLHYLRYCDGRREAQVECDGEEVPWGTILDGILASAGPHLERRKEIAYGYFAITLRSLGGPDSAADDEVRIRRMFPSGRVVISGGEGTDLWRAPLPYGRGMNFHLSLDGGGFVAVDPPQTHFFDSTLPGHLRRTYLLAFVFPCAQRIAMIDLSARLIGLQSVEDELPDRLRSVAELQRGLVAVVTRSRFAQVFPGQNQHAVYRGWVEAFELGDLEAEVAHELQAVQAQLTLELDEVRTSAAQESADEAVAARRASERVERRFAVAGLAFAFGSLALGVLGVNIHGLTTGIGMDLVHVALIVASFTGSGAAVGWFVTRPAPKSKT